MNECVGQHIGVGIQQLSPPPVELRRTKISGRRIQHRQAKGARRRIDIDRRHGDHRVRIQPSGITDQPWRDHLYDCAAHESLPTGFLGILDLFTDRHTMPERGKAFDVSIRRVDRYTAHWHRV